MEPNTETRAGRPVKDCTRCNVGVEQYLSIDTLTQGSIILCGDCCISYVCKHSDENMNRIFKFARREDV